MEKELDREVLDEAHICADHARDLHGSSLRSILFYGSCQRAESPEGVLDLYLLTESNRAFHSSKLMAGLNYAIPPNIYFYSLTHAGEALRAKVAAIALGQFGQSCRDETPSASIWARFCQPAVLLWSADEAAREETIDHIVDALRTAARWAAKLGPTQGTPRDFWVALFLATYRAELRPETADRAVLIYETYAERYDALLTDAWDAEGITWERVGEELRVDVDAKARASAERRWARRVREGKGISIARVAKGAFTFDGGVDYLLWKIERHSGVSIEPTPWQRRHPFLSSPVLLAKLLREGGLR